jgi:hypothetical protein
MRSLLMATISQSKVSLQAIHSVDDPAASQVRLSADVTTLGRQSNEVESIALRLSIEPGVSSLTWALAHESME